MPLRLCVIGNSHLAAMKLGWDALLSRGDPLTRAIDPVFFGAPRDGMKHVRLEAGALVPTRAAVTESFRRLSGGQERIDLSGYDAFLLVGLGMSSKRILRFYRSHAWQGLSGVAEKTLVHPAFAAEFLAERYATTRIVEIAGLISSATDRPILALAEPHWASWARTAGGETPDYGWGLAIAHGDAPGIGRAFAAACAAALAPQARFLAQPEETVEHDLMTRPEFNKEASRLISGEGGGTDASHMNAAYGLAIWPVVIGALSDASAGEAAVNTASGRARRARAKA